jgi:hypothetical protein
MSACSGKLMDCPGAVAHDDVLDDEVGGGRTLGSVDLGLAVRVSHALHPNR